MTNLVSTTLGQLAAALHAVRFRFTGAREFRLLVGEAEPCREQMAAFGRQTDEEFSALARSLGQLNEQFGSMQSEVRQLNDILQDRDQTHALGMARTLCKNSIELVHASLGIAHSVQEQMKRVDEGLVHACRMREEFDKSFLMLRTLAMGFRVEAARVDSEFQGVFANVAAAISDIDRRIAASTQAAFSQVDELVREAAAERERVSRDETGTFSGANTMIDQVRADLDSLGGALAPCAAVIARIDDLLGGTGPRVMAVLGGLQYQDIVRQRLEHVADGFEDICEAVQQGKSSSRHDLAYVGKAAAIQHGQLRSARSEIERGGREVVEGMEGLLSLGRDVLAGMDELGDVANSVLSSNKIADMFAREIGELTHIAAASETASRRVSDLVERIGTVVGVFSEDITKQEREVKLIALNAQVAAARLLDAGALEKLAEETTRISNHNAQVSSDLAAGLRETLGRLTAIKTETTEFLSVVSVEKTVIEQGAAEIGAALRSHSETVQAMTCAVRRNFAKVHASLRTTLDGVNFPAAIEACFGPAEDLCGRLTAASGAGAGVATEADARLEAHAARYTMEREREAHAAAAHAQAAPAAPAAPARAADDIELF